MNWELEKMRSDIIPSLEASTADGNGPVSYASGNRRAAQYLDGSTTLIASCSATARPTPRPSVMATALLTISAATGKMTSGDRHAGQAHRPHRLPAHPTDQCERRRRMARHVPPSLPFRDLMQDPVIINTLQYAWDRGRDNPLFTAARPHLQRGDHPRGPRDAGSSPERVAAASMWPCPRCAAAQRSASHVAQRMKSTTNTRDYGYMHGVGIQEMRGIGKLRFGRRPNCRHYKASRCRYCLCVYFRRGRRLKEVTMATKPKTQADTPPDAPPAPTGRTMEELDAQMAANSIGAQIILDYNSDAALERA